MSCYSFVYLYLSEIPALVATIQGCALRKIVRSPVLWSYKMYGAQHMFCMKKLRFSSHLRAEGRRQGPLGSVRAQLCNNNELLNKTCYDSLMVFGDHCIEVKQMKLCLWEVSSVLYRCLLYTSQLSNRPHFLLVYRRDNPHGMMGEHEPKVSDLPGFRVFSQHPNWAITPINP